MVNAAAETLIAVAEQDPATLSLDLHGEFVDNALKSVDVFLDQSAHAGVDVVKIVYGVGSGALAETIPSFIKQHPSVVYARESFVSGEAGSVVYAALRS